jgi:hypothetical protein
VLGWLGKKIEAAAESFAQGFGKTLGLAAAGVVLAGGALLIPSLVQLITRVVEHTTQWLSHVILPF